MLRKKTTETAAHHALSLTGGFLGIYALLIRDGTFGSAETSNLILLVVSGLTGSAGELLVRLGAAFGWQCVRRWGVPSVLACLPLLGVGLAATIWDEHSK